MESEHDQAFLQILREEKNITNFLDAFFGFLYRCTDFYVESTSEQKLGFPPGVSEKLILTSFQKWKQISTLPTRTDPPKSQKAETQNPEEQEGNSGKAKTEEFSSTPDVSHEVEIGNSKDEEVDSKTTTEFSEKDRSSDSYNGAVRENYTWSQTISDLDVLVKLPSGLRTSKDLRVNLDSQNVKIEARTAAIEWTTIFEGEFSFRTRKDESVWSIVPGRHISIHLEKASERWWEALIIGEPKIELSKIDCSRNLDEMGSAEQMKVQELMWNHRQKVLGKPTSEQIKMEKILKQAWDAKGSPFQGTAYDPSILKFN